MHPSAFGGFEGFDIAQGAVGPSILQSELDNGNAGNEIGTDPLPIWLHEVDSAINGILTYKVYNSRGGGVPNPKTFTVDRTGKTTLQTAEAVAAGFNAINTGGATALCVPLPAFVHASPDITRYSSQPDEFDCQYFVRVTNTNNANIKEIAVIGQPGQLLVGEGSNGAPQGVSVPTLNQWGVVGLVLMIIVTSFWFLRRRFRAVQS